MLMLGIMHQVILPTFGNEAGSMRAAVTLMRGWLDVRLNNAVPQDVPKMLPPALPTLLSDDPDEPR